MTEHRQSEKRLKQVTFRELHSSRLRRDRFEHLASRLYQSLSRQFGSLKCRQTFADFIAEAICCFHHRCRQKRSFANNDRPAFPYLLKSAQRIAMASLAGDGKSDYEKARRLECSTKNSEIAFELSQATIETGPTVIEELRIADKFIDIWSQLSVNQQFVLKASGNALVSGFELRAEMLAGELEAVHSPKTFSANTIRQYKSCALTQIKKETALVLQSSRIKYEENK